MQHRCSHFKQPTLKYTQHGTLPGRVQLHLMHMIYLFFRMSGPSLSDHAFAYSFTCHWCVHVNEGHRNKVKKMRGRQPIPWSTSQKQTSYLFSFCSQPAGGDSLSLQTLKKGSRKDPHWWHNRFLSVRVALCPSQKSQWQDYLSSMWHSGVFRWLLPCFDVV